MKIAVIDYNAGNLHSVKKAFDRLGAEAIVTNDKSEIEQADKLVLPGVGHFAHGMRELQSLNLLELLNGQVCIRKKPILGICLGMQLFTKSSSEGNSTGLGWVDAHVNRFDPKQLDERMKVPHMGWNNVHLQKESSLLKGLTNDSTFYFVHSYYITNNHAPDLVGETKYGLSFTSVFEKDNIYGVQFHPEKSHEDGLKLLENFLSI